MNSLATLPIARDKAEDLAAWLPVSIEAHIEAYAMFILIAGGDRKTPEHEHLGDRTWAIIGWVEIQETTAYVRTVAYYGIPVGPSPVLDQWIDVRSY